MLLHLSDLMRMMRESCSLDFDIIVGSSPQKFKDLMKTYQHRYSEKRFNLT